MSPYPHPITSIKSYSIVDISTIFIYEDKTYNFVNNVIGGD